MIKKFAILITFLPIITASGCSDEPVSGSMEIASSNLEGAFEAPPPSPSSSSEIARNQLLRNGWSIKTIDANEGGGYSVSTQYNTRGTISDKDIELINTLGNVQTLALSQSDDPIDFSNAALAQLRGNKSIETLHIGWSNINDQGMEHLKFLPNLEHLYVDSPFSMTDLGMEHIRQIKGLRKLRASLQIDKWREKGYGSRCENISRRSRTHVEEASISHKFNACTMANRGALVA